MTEMCHCGKPLHYTDKEVEDKVRKLIAELGEFIPVKLTDQRIYRVPRHYIALHGINGKDLPTLGFERMR